MAEKALRYKVIEDSNTSHCCFNASVLDTSRKNYNGDGKLIEDQYDAICECYEVEDAEKICKLLNDAENSVS